MKKFKLWVPVVLWMGIIFFFSSIPGLSSGLDYDYFLRKVAHVSEYLILTFLLYRAFDGTFKLDLTNLFFYSGIVSFFYAVSDEVHQLHVPFRHGAFEDVLIDSIGIILFCIFRANKEIIFKIFLRKEYK